MDPIKKQPVVEKPMRRPPNSLAFEEIPKSWKT
jgi:hypothetical protein